MVHAVANIPNLAQEAPDRLNLNSKVRLTALSTRFPIGMPPPICMQDVMTFRGRHLVRDWTKYPLSSNSTKHDRERHDLTSDNSLLSEPKTEAEIAASKAAPTPVSASAVKKTNTGQGELRRPANRGGPILCEISVFT